MRDFFEEIWDEITDFFEDFSEQFFKKPKKATESRTVLIGGVRRTVRPAYIFAERIDNLIKLVIGASITISAFTATFLGFASLSDLIDLLIKSFLGRTFMFFTGLSYLIIAFWKLSHLNPKNT